MADDIITPRLILRLMQGEVVDACLAGDLARAGQLLGVTIPDELLDQPSSLKFAQLRLNECPEYQPWSMRAIILSDARTPDARTMVGHIRFHGRPDPDYRHPFARSAVEFGYQVYPRYRRRGYATEAAGAAMEWARTTFGVGRFVASVSPDNTASLAVIARFGFAKVGQQMDEVDGIEDIYLRDVTV